MATAVPARQRDLFIPGLFQDERGVERPRTLIDIPGFDAACKFDQMRGARGDVYEDELLAHMSKGMGLGPTALVLLDRRDARTGKIISRTITHNVETDYGVNALLKLFGNAGAGTVAPFIAIDTATATAVMSGASITNASGAQTTIAVVSGGAAAAVAGNTSTSFIANASNNGSGQNNSAPGANPDPRFGTGIIWTYGVPANTEYVAGTTSASGATSINITSYTVAGGKTHAAGDFVVAGPSTADGSNAVAPAGITYSPTQAATYTAPQGATGGIGQRKAQLQYIFPVTTPAASYTGLWIVTSVTWAAGVGYAHLVTNPQTINGSTTLTATWILTV